jgi:voltage-gated potassium channel
MKETKTAPPELAPDAAPAENASSWRSGLHEIIFEADSPAGKNFDIALLVAILFSVMAVVLESVDVIRQGYGPILLWVEWTFTILFTFEYILRLASVGRPWAYATSFFGLVDLLSILPTYLSLFVPGTQSLLVIRALRLLRVFRVLKLAYFVGEAAVLGKALRASVRKIIIFLGTVLTLVLILGALMYLIEGEENGFTSIPQAIYWAIVTMTTVGYGDIAPQTVLGKALASAVMIIGYAILAVPTGIVTVELASAQNAVSTQACPQCSAEGHDHDARFCKRCGARL